MVSAAETDCRGGLPMSTGRATRIGYVLKVFPRLSQTFILNELRAHEAAGLDLVVFSLKPPREADAGLVDPPLRSPVVTLSGPRASWSGELARAIGRFGIDHLHAHFANVATEVAREAAAATGIPYSFTAHAIDIFDQRVDPAVLQGKLDDASMVFTVSDYNVRHLRERYGAEVTRIYNGLPLDRFPCRLEGREEGSLLAVGRLVEKKGFGVLVEACSRLARAGIRFRCSIVGEGPLRPRLERAIADHDLEARVELLGALPPEAVRERLGRATALVAPCRIASSGDRDGLPTVLLEAMASGTPCIGTDVTGIPEVVIDGRTGIRVPPDDPDRLATACQVLLEDPVMAKRLARAARRSVEKRFDARRTSARLRACWKSRRPCIAFRIHNRRGLGHWMRAMNIAREIVERSTDAEVVIYSRARVPLVGGSERIRQVVAPDPEDMGLGKMRASGIEPDVLVDDTILPPGVVDPEIKRVFILRKRRRDKLGGLIQDLRLHAPDLVIAPHLPAEFNGSLPRWLEEKIVFVGPIARRPRVDLVDALRAKYGLVEGDRLLVTTPGGGGFEADSLRLFEIARHVHELVSPSRFRHVFVSGPNAKSIPDRVAPGMTVVSVEPEMPTLLSLATAVISAGGYNTVNEIRLARRPAFFVPGERKYDDQHERVMGLVRAGLAWCFESGMETRCVAEGIADRLRDEAAFDRVMASFARDGFRTGNDRAAREILECANP